MGALRLLRHGGPPLEITQDRVLVGRDPSCDIVLDDKSISRRHAYLERRGGGWGVIDQGSANGTFVNGEQVVDAMLFDGQELRLGMVPLRVQVESDMPGTMLMEGGPAGGTVLMPSPASPPPPRPGPPVSVAPSAAPPPAWGAAPPGYAMAAQPAYAPAPSPQDEAAALLGLPANATARQVSARYEELSADLNAKLASARTPHLKQTYQKNLDEVRRASEILSPGFLVGVSEDELPAVQPVVDTENPNVEMAIPIRQLSAAPAEASPKSGAPALLTTVFTFTTMTLLALCAFFKLSVGKMEKESKKKAGSGEIQKALADSEKYVPVDILEKNGALKNGAFKLCNKASRPLEVAWLGVVYAQTLQEGGYTAKAFNSAYCRGEFKLVIPAGAEAIPKVDGADPKCKLNGEGVFFGLAMKDPKDPEQFVRTSGAFNQRQDCINIGEGW